MFAGANLGDEDDSINSTTQQHWIHWILDNYTGVDMEPLAQGITFNAIGSVTYIFLWSDYGATGGMH